MDVNGLGAAIGQAGASGPAQTEPAGSGFDTLTSEDFLNMLIIQLQNQDPTEPMTNDELLGQLSQIHGIQSNVELSETLEDFSSGQQLSLAAGLIGKTVSGKSAEHGAVTGPVQRAFLRDGQSYVEVEDVEVPLSEVTSVDGETG